MAQEYASVAFHQNGGLLLIITTHSTFNRFRRKMMKFVPVSLRRELVKDRVWWIDPEYAIPIAALLKNTFKDTQLIDYDHASSDFVFPPLASEPDIDLATYEDRIPTDFDAMDDHDSHSPNHEDDPPRVVDRPTPFDHMDTYNALQNHVEQVEAAWEILNAPLQNLLTSPVHIIEAMKAQDGLDLAKRTSIRAIYWLSGKTEA